MGWTRNFRTILFGFILITLVFSATEKYWQAVEAALQDGLPKTAIENLNKILEMTQKEKQYSEWLRALSEKIVMEATIEGNKPEEKVKRLKAEFAAADNNTRPLLQAVLAQWYWQYYNRNQWRFMNRTATEKMVEEDFTTWDLRKIFREIDSLYQDILKEEDLLGKIPVEKFFGFLEEGTMPAKLRPTLFDFIAQEALIFYTSAEWYAALPEDAFEIDANTNAFGPLKEFMKYRPVTEDTNSPKFKAISLYQALVKFHGQQKNTEALLDVDVQRLNYMKNIAFGEEKNKIFIQRLSELVEQYGDLSLSSMVSYYLARAWADAGYLVKAYNIARQGYDRFPESIGGNFCKAYMTELLAKALSLNGEQCIPPRVSKIRVSYKNFTELNFRIYEDNWDDFMKREYGYPNEIDSVKIMKLLAKTPYKAWKVDLDSTADLKQKTVEIDLPALEPGYYRIFASWQTDFKKSSMVQHTWLWVSNFTLISRTRSAIIDGLVLNAVTGEPVPGAAVLEIKQKDWRKYEFGAECRTDSNGHFEFKARSNTEYQGCYLLVKKQGEELLKSDMVYAYSYNENEQDNRIVFFTDRSLYRPGQTIYFKGICVHVDQEGNDYEVIPNREAMVYFRDANSQEVAKMTLKTNDFGSFSGQFTAPADRLTGSMSISCDEPYGYASFRVEEYKRPKFTVEVETPKEAFKLNQEVEVAGKATAYTSAPVDNASVRFTVTRNVGFPYWWYWFYPWRYYSSTSQQIAHGKIKTDAEGKFKITFLAKPDPSISPDDDPTFNFSINADVTSPDGETRSGSAYVTLGYSALSIRLSTPDQLQDKEKFPLVVLTQTLDGNNIPGKGRIEIYKLKEPQKPVPAKIWSYNYWDYGVNYEDTTEQEEFSSNWMTWPKGEMIYETGFATELSDPETLDIKLAAGLYKVECVAKDKFGKEVRAFLPLKILPDWNAEKLGIKIPSIVETNSSTIEVGRDLQVLWGTGYDTGRCFVEIEHDGAIIKRYWTDQGRTLYSFKFPVIEKFRGGFTVHMTQVRENRAYINSLPINVPWDNKELDITLETFRNKLQPGTKESITLKIKGKKSAITAAEMVATMYDFSLDQFYAHYWYSLDFFKRDYSRMYATFINNAQWYETWHNYWNEDYSYPVIDYIHFPGYVIEDFFYYRFPAVSKVIYTEQEQGKFEGKVFDAQTGDALAGAEVVIEGTEFSTTTDENGHFEIPLVPIGEYSVTVSYAGYDPITLTGVKYSKGKTTDLTFKLNQATYYYEEGLANAEAAPSVVAQRQTVSSGRGGFAADEVGVPAKGAEGVVAAKAPATIPPVTGETRVQPIDLKAVTIRRNLNETAFFYPHLLMDKEGGIKIEFTVPEALTKWKFMGLAHGKKCESGMIAEYAVTQKELMVQPNAPRFLREGDTVYFTAKVTNMSDNVQKGKVQLDFKDFITEAPMNPVLGLADYVQNFEIDAHGSKAFSWKIYIPKGTNPLAYTVAAKSGALSDGEAGAIPVLSSRIFLTESCPLWIRGPQTKKFDFERLKEIGKSETFEPFRFTVQMASNPSWYAIQALPYLIEFPYECSEQVFNRLYANSLAGYIASSNPRIRQIFDQWRGTDALKSNLEKNEDLKAVTLMETPWVIEAQDETQAKRNVGILFEENTLNRNLNSAFNKLKNMQLSDGSWPWFPGGWPDPYITLYITTGFGRLRHLSVKTDISLALRSLDYLDRWIKEVYDDIINKSTNNLSPIIAFYLYGRSFYQEDQPVPQYAKQAVDYFIQQGEEYWLTLDSRLSQGYLALALCRFGKPEIPKKIQASIKERSVQNEEMGMFWREDEFSWWWYRAPIETQALMIEAFSEVTNDTIAMEDCKVWLLKQKQTQNWQTTKATADAVYALVLRGTDYLSSTKLVQVKLGDMEVKPEKVEAGTGFYEKSYFKDEIKKQFSDISVIKEEKGIAWGGAHFQYFEEIDKVTPHVTNLQLDKKLFVKRETKKGTIIEPVSGPLNVGDLLTIRIILKADRDMEYVHLKDLRGSGLEPVDVLSFYRYQDGLRYYQSTKDVATHFFIDYLPKGTYIFEYDLRVQLKGRYQCGVAEIQCMYAPEFNSHSESEWLEVK